MPITSTAAPSSTSAAAVQDTVRLAAETGTPLRIVGGGHWLDAGRPVRGRDDRPPAVLSVGALTGVVEYVPGDLTLTARAGTTLAQIEETTVPERQWLALDPFGGDGGTLGGSVATASPGPLAQAFGLPRDNVLGLEFVTGEGTVVRGGGRVVKNVAGFDLTRLLVGSWGTLGLLTEVSVRLRALPEADVTVALAMPADPAAATEQLAQLRAAPLTPLALELLNAPLARVLRVGDRPVVLARLGGNEELVRSQEATLSTLGDVADVAADVWRRLRGAEPADAAVVRCSQLPARIGETWAHALAALHDFPGALIHATVGRGVVRCVVPTPVSYDETYEAALARAFGAPFAGTRIFERLPAPLWPALAPSPTRDRLSRGVKQAFDPRGILNPGILGEELTGASRPANRGA